MRRCDFSLTIIGFEMKSRKDSDDSTGSGVARGPADPTPATRFEKPPSPFAASTTRGPSPDPVPTPVAPGKGTGDAGRWLSRHAFILAGLTLALGIGWFIGANSFDHHGASTRQLALEIGRIDARLETLARQIPPVSQATEIAALETRIDNLKSALDITRVRTADAVSQVKARIDAAQRAPAAQIQTVLRRIDRIEQSQAEQMAEPMPVATTLPPPEPVPVATAFAQPSPEVAPRATQASFVKPALLPASVRAAIPPGGYVLRQVEDGIAFIESRDGLRTVEPGQVLPGAGKVRAIEKRGDKWVVVTSGGVIDGDLY
jgi:hypothetical protein